MAAEWSPLSLVPLSLVPFSLVPFSLVPFSLVMVGEGPPTMGDGTEIGQGVDGGPLPTMTLRKEFP
jgi:hypothetical protein